MKNFKRIQAMFLAIIMAVMTIGATTAFAAENTSMENVHENEKNLVASGTYDALITTDRRSITTSKSAAGSSFICLTGTIKFNATFNQVDGNTILAVRLYQVASGGNILLREWQSSNGSIRDSISVSPNGTYIFEYLLARGTKTVSVTNSIYQPVPSSI